MDVDITRLFFDSALQFCRTQFFNFTALTSILKQSLQCSLLLLELLYLQVLRHLPHNPLQYFREALDIFRHFSHLVHQWSPVHSLVLLLWRHRLPTTQFHHSCPNLCLPIPQHGGWASVISHHQLPDRIHLPTHRNHHLLHVHLRGNLPENYIRCCSPCCREGTTDEDEGD